MRIIGLDPGGTTGWATWDVPAGGLTAWGAKDWLCGQIGPEEHHLELDEFLGRQHVWSTTIVCEHFDWRPSKQSAAYGDRKVELISREYEGVVKRFVRERNESFDHEDVGAAKIKLVFQQPSEALGFVKDDNLKKLGLWVPGWKHAMDAYRHILYYVMKQAPASLSTPLLQKGWK